MLTISDTSTPTKGRVWKSGTKHQSAEFSSRGISKGVFAQVTQPDPHPDPAGCPSACAWLIQLKGQVFCKQRCKHEFCLGWFLFWIERLHKERTNIHFHEGREDDSIPLCHPPNTTNHPNLSHRTGCSPGRQGVLTPKGTAHNKHL